MAVSPGDSDWVAYIRTVWSTQANVSADALWIGRFDLTIWIYLYIYKGKKREKDMVVLMWVYLFLFPSLLFFLSFFFFFFFFFFLELLPLFIERESRLFNGE